MGRGASLDCPALTGRNHYGKSGLISKWDLPYCDLDLLLAYL
jgi:hypothetical protein